MLLLLKRRCLLSQIMFSKYHISHVNSDIQLLSIHRQIVSVILKKGKSKFVESMNPFVYSDSIQSVVPSDAGIGDECVVCDSRGNVMGRGVYNPESLYRVRVLALASEHCSERDKTIDPLSIPLPELIIHRLKEALYVRQTILNLPNELTTVYRLVNGEGDRLSGLMIDVFNSNYVVVQSSAAWIEKYRDSIISSLNELFSNSVSVKWLQMTSRLKQDGWLTDTVEISDSKVDERAMPNEIYVLENGLSYVVRPGYGQKTGFYCDQRENRYMMRKFFSGNVLGQVTDFVIELLLT